MKAVEDPGWFGNVFVDGRLSLLLGDSRGALGSVIEVVVADNPIGRRAA